MIGLRTASEALGGCAFAAQAGEFAKLLPHERYWNAEWTILWAYNSGSRGAGFEAWLALRMLRRNVDGEDSSTNLSSRFPAR